MRISSYGFAAIAAVKRKEARPAQVERNVFHSNMTNSLVLGQGLDLIESRPELHIQAVPEPATAAPRP